jgi:hypothetical protein
VASFWVGVRLRERVRPVEQEDSNLLVPLVAHIYGSVNTIGWILPPNLSRRDLEAMAVARITVFNDKGITAEHTATRGNGS